MSNDINYALRMLHRVKAAEAAKREKENAHYAAMCGPITSRKISETK